MGGEGNSRKGLESQGERHSLLSELVGRGKGAGTEGKGRRLRVKRKSETPEDSKKRARVLLMGQLTDDRRLETSRENRKRKGGVLLRTKAAGTIKIISSEEAG